MNHAVSHRPHQAEVLSFISAFGIAWRAGGIWIAPGSSLNPHPRAPCLLHAAYEQRFPVPPSPEELAIVLAELAAEIPAEQQAEFEVEARILRAAAQTYYAP